MSESIKKQDILHKIATGICLLVPEQEQNAAETFANLYYANVSLGDLEETPLPILIDAVHVMWTFGRKRLPKQMKIHIYPQAQTENKTSAPQTIVEIVNDNMPFLVDSVVGAINSLGYSISLVIHPVIQAERNKEGILTHVSSPPPNTKRGLYESFIHCEISGILSQKKSESLKHEIARSLEDVRNAVSDWHLMRENLEGAITNLKKTCLTVTQEEKDEILAFLKWLENDHFTFLGFCEYLLVPGHATLQKSLVPQEGLGILRKSHNQEITHIFAGVELTPTNRNYFNEASPLIITKATKTALVHRRDPMDALTIKKFDDKGNLTGCYQFIGLFTSVAYNQSARKIPLLREKISHILARSGFDEQWHDGKTLVHILESFPRDELFQASEEWLLETSMAILQLQNRQRPTLFIRPDTFGRFVSCIVYIPREKYDSELRRKIEKILEKALGGKSTKWQTQMGDLAFARIHYTITCVKKQLLPYDAKTIEREISNAALNWRDHLLKALLRQHGDLKGKELFERYGAGFTKGYQERFCAEDAILDIQEMEKALATKRLRSNLVQSKAKNKNALTFKVYAVDAPIALSDILPVLENMNLRVLSEIPFVVTLADAQNIWVHDFEVQNDKGKAVVLELVRENFLKGFSHVWHEESEDDGFNRLILQAHLEWRECQLIRAYAKYIRQLQVTFSQAYMEITLATHPQICRLMLDLFLCLFCPSYTKDRKLGREKILHKIETYLKSVSTLDEEDILRKFVNAIDATVRTNYYQTYKGKDKPYISFKIECAKIEEMPLPRPQFEIFVYSPQVEAIHLRGGKVARGGIRWSERREDFRTEILSLMKAQMVKNTVIIPVGSKGGFIVKRTEPKRPVQNEVIACYEIFMRGLLDLTDTIKDQLIIPPPDVIRHDGDDPYLVVAADKGTASFSDYANKIASEYGFWLGDAFASGGSTGYDHKKMGITARGAWESVKHHFYEISRDATTEELTVVGIGDMSGDVFGNGMLMSRHLKLLGAFNQSHIFIDPSPSPSKSYQERKRLFNLPQSTWADYNPQLISKGGGVFDRHAKSIPITPEMKDVFDIQEDFLTPVGLIRYLLRASVDLLWLGGIGTYVKAKEESNSDVEDRANDTLRINGEGVRALVVGEGANLGFTQRGRIEYALKGGRINTDAIDNSAGVDCSDHEVNIKILLNPIVTKEALSFSQRNTLLEAMTDNVANSVLQDNIWQNQTISLSHYQGMRPFNEQTALLRTLESEGLLNRTLENLPDETELGRRSTSKQPLTRPELAILLAYAKISLKNKLSQSEISTLFALEEKLIFYFPQELQKRYKKEISSHPLRKEIISTLLTNTLIDKMGITFINELKRQINRSEIDIAKAYLTVENLLDLPALWQALIDLKNEGPDWQTELIQRTRDKVKRLVEWFLRSTNGDTNLDKLLCNFKPGVDLLYKQFPALFAPLQRKTYEDKYRVYKKKGMPLSLIKKILSLGALISAPDIILLNKEVSCDLENIARVYFALGQELHLEWLRSLALKLSGATHWQQEAASVFIDAIYKHQIAITRKILLNNRGQCQLFTEEGALSTNLLNTTSFNTHLEDIMNSKTPDFSMLMVLNHQLHLLAEPSTF